MDPKDLVLAADLQPEQAHSYLKALGFRRPEEADRHLEELVKLVGHPEPVAQALPRLMTALSSSADPDAGLAHLVSYMAAFGNHHMMLNLIRDDARVAELLATILGSSPFLTQILLRNPEYAFYLLERNSLEQVWGLEDFRKKVATAIRPFSSSPMEALDALRRLRRRETLRIGTQDLMNLRPLPQIVAQVSDLAEAMLEEALQQAGEKIDINPDGFAIVGLGKLGGRELNFSSDVDLLYIHSDNAEHADMVRLAKEFTRIVGELTSEGRLYRVDLRLRPMGRTGEIVYSKSASLQYYETWADTMDRLALIKSRPVAGDRTLGEEFVDELQSFVFRKYLDFAAVEEIRWTKRRTDRELRRRGQADGDVKMGLGGIREIEFFVQSFQLLYGGLHPELRSPSTLTTLDRLLDLGFINPDDHRALRQAYFFLRRLEHKLQLVHDLQTHSLPTDPEELGRCARRMGYQGSLEEAADLLMRDLARHNREVRRIFESLFDEENGGRGVGEIILNPDIESQEALRRLEAAGVKDPEPFLEGLRLLVAAPAFPHSPTRVRNLLANLLPLFVDRAQRAPDIRRMFIRLDRFCEVLQSRAPLYAEMNESPEFAKRLLTVLNLSDSIAETLIAFPELLDSVAVPVEPDDPLPALIDHRRQALVEGVEPREALRRFRRREVLKVAVRELVHPGDPYHRLHLTRLAEACLEVAWDTALEAHPRVAEQACALIGLGKLGGRETAIHSDLDLVFIFDDSAPACPYDELLEFLHDLRRELTEYTPSGRAYEVDFRLRPEGRKAAEAVPLKYLYRYFEERADAWECLAWVKARLLRSQDLELALDEVLGERQFSAPDLADLRHVRLRKEQELGGEEPGRVWNLKVGRGALLDVQFLVQWLQLRFQVWEPNLLDGLDQLLALSFIGEADWDALAKAARFFFALEMARDLVTDQDSARISAHSPDLPLTAEILGFNTAKDLLSHYEETTKHIREIFDRWFPPS